MTILDDAPPAELSGLEPPALAAIPGPSAPAAADDKPARKRRSGTSGAERARRARAAAGTPPKDRKPAAPRVAPLDKRLKEALELVGTMVGTFVDPYDGAVITHNAERASKVLAGMAARKPAFGRMLERFLSAGDNVDGLVLLVGMALPILVNHGVVPAKFGVLGVVMGTTPPAPDADALALREMMGTMMSAGAAPAEAAAA